MRAQLGAGLKAIQIKEHREMETTCFFVVRTDGSVDDVSYRKCALPFINVQAGGSCLLRGLDTSRCCTPCLCTRCQAVQAESSW